MRLCHRDWATLLRSDDEDDAKQRLKWSGDIDYAAYPDWIALFKLLQA